MFFESYVFIIALGVIGMLVVHKIWEMRHGASVVPNVLIEKSDGLVNATLGASEGAFWERIERAFIGAIRMIEHVSRAIALLIVHRIHGWSSALLDKLRSKHLKRNRNSVSFPLKHIGEDLKKQEENKM
ncbi:MAG TPA: hypothetical protein VI981_01335 [Candidatus Paceibacterota bacterium]